jgi:DNA replication protein DnaC
LLPRLTDVAAELLQTIVHQRYKQRRSIVVTSNRVIQDWGKYLRDATAHFAEDEHPFRSNVNGR